MLAQQPLPHRYVSWNRAHRAPWGRRGKRLIDVLGPSRPTVARYFGPYGWQPNNSLRRFEYPWAFERISALGDGLSVVDVGAGMAGFQFTLAQAGYDVHAVDPGMNARGRGWRLDPDQHAFLARTYDAPVRLHPATLGNAGFADNSIDVLISISTIEHFAAEDLTELAREARRVLRPGGHVVLTIDLFLNVEPFSRSERNEYGTNIDVRRLLDECGVALVEGEPCELHGFDEFDAERIRAEPGRYLVSATYPVMAQCLVAKAAG